MLTQKTEVENEITKGEKKEEKEGGMAVEGMEVGKEERREEGIKKEKRRKREGDKTQERKLHINIPQERGSQLDQAL